MSDFMAKMHQIRFPLGLRRRHRWGSLSPGPLAVFRGSISTWKRGRGAVGKGKGEGKEGEVRVAQVEKCTIDSRTN